VKDRCQTVIGAKEPLQDWSDIHWKAVAKRVRNLRRRIFRATKSGQLNQVRSLMRLMLRSYSNLLHSVRKVTQVNKGKKTAGIDSQKVLTPKARVKLVREMLKYEAWKVSPARRVYIPKAGGKQRPLGILTIKNRVAQAIVKNALEPSWEARFEPNSYGFRPGRSCHDAIVQCWNRLNKHSTHKWALDADLRSAFDKICHTFVLNKLGNVPGRELIKQWLEAGYVEAEIFHATECGVPQGGVISPLAANIALDGLETHLGRKYSYIRYADDFIVTAKSRMEIEAVLPTIVAFFKERGLELNMEKTKIVHVKDGLNFLGYNVRSYKNKCIVKPARERVLSLQKEIRDWLKHNQHARPEAVIGYLNPKLRGWANYHKRVNSKSTFRAVGSQIWRAIWCWCLRRHRRDNKPKDWVKRKYFKRVNGRDWTFFGVFKDELSGVRKEVYLLHLSNTPVKPHTKVAGANSPDDPSLDAYWTRRAQRFKCTREELLDAFD
jgi:RNA-directed DNA polymerase